MKKYTSEELWRFVRADMSFTLGPESIVVRFAHYDHSTYLSNNIDTSRGGYRRSWQQFGVSRSEMDEIVAEVHGGSAKEVQGEWRVIEGMRTKGVIEVILKLQDIWDRPTIVIKNKKYKII